MVSLYLVKEYLRVSMNNWPLLHLKLVISPVPLLFGCAPDILKVISRNKQVVMYCRYPKMSN